MWSLSSKSQKSESVSIASDSVCIATNKKKKPDL
jgi:hypothetical protein